MPTNGLFLGAWIRPVPEASRCFCFCCLVLGGVAECKPRVFSTLGFLYFVLKLVSWLGFLNFKSSTWGSEDFSGIEAPPFVGTILETVGRFRREALNPCS